MAGPRTHHTPEMQNPLRELFHMAAPVAVEVIDSEENPDTVTVKGFASVETTDRSGDIVPPEEFKIKQFMAAPTLLVNHKLWIDDSGNGVAAGRPLSVHATKLAKNDNEDLWSVIDLETREKINTFPKDRVPNLGVGDRGLFVTAKITEPGVVSKVSRGELSSFSWRGLVTVDYRINQKTHTTERIFTNIDLMEISLANVPDNPDSTLMVGKTADQLRENPPLVMSTVRLEKGRFETKGIALEYLKAHNFRSDAVREDDNSFFSLQQDQNDLQLDKLVTVKMNDGVNLIAGPLKAGFHHSRSQSWFVTALGRESVEELAALYSPPGESSITSDKEKVMSEASTKVEGQSGATATADDEKKVDTEKAEETTLEKKVETTDSTTPSDEEKAVDVLSDQIAKKTSEGVATIMTPLFENLSKVLEGVGSSMSQMAEKMSTGSAGQTTEPKTETDAETDKTEAQKSADLTKQVNVLAQTLLDTQEQIVEVAKTVKASNEALPETTERDEKLETQKTSDEKKDDDPNSVLDSAFPFLQD